MKTCGNLYWGNYDYEGLVDRAVVFRAPCVPVKAACVCLACSTPGPTTWQAPAPRPSTMGVCVVEFVGVRAYPTMFSLNVGGLEFFANHSQA